MRVVKGHRDGELVDTAAPLTLLFGEVDRAVELHQIVRVGDRNLSVPGNVNLGEFLSEADHCGTVFDGGNTTIRSLFLFFLLSLLISSVFSNHL